MQSCCQYYNRLLYYSKGARFCLTDELFIDVRIQSSVDYLARKHHFSWIVLLLKVKMDDQT